MTDHKNKLPLSSIEISPLLTEKEPFDDGGAATTLQFLDEKSRLLQESLIDLYLSVKIRSNDEVNTFYSITGVRLTTTQRTCS